eukprot:TRINITY_DN25928_c0_g1_i2.p2 TRINITY_DN25928_c0_g1~~TRINITY_DN25928_c0_g1_i2.p2  ORF type:complete len:136 (+),score=22.17 TRINITY_DN25928_c0_g1_i2:279-686(+)
MPVIGHMGVAGPDGQIYDFSGAPFGNGRGKMMVGSVVRYIQLRPGAARKAPLGTAIRESNDIYKDRCHNIVMDNCHSHVAVALEIAGYQGISRWNMVMLAIWMFVSGKYVDTASVLKHWLPFCVILAVFLWIHGW